MPAGKSNDPYHLNSTRLIRRIPILEELGLLFLLAQAILKLQDEFSLPLVPYRGLKIGEMLVPFDIEAAIPPVFLNCRITSRGRIAERRLLFADLDIITL